MDLVAFLLARLDEDERGAREACDRKSGEWFVGRKWNVYAVEDETPQDDVETNQLIVYGNMLSQSEHIARHGPARVLREVAVKRRLLEIAAEMRDRAADSEDYSHRSYADQIERTVAAPYADHPDYDPAWRVE